MNCSDGCGLDKPEISGFTPEEEEQGRIAKEILLKKGKLSCEEMSAKHTPTPWEVVDLGVKKFLSTNTRFEIHSSDHYIKDVAIIVGDGTGPKANAELIIRAANAYAANQKTIAALLEAAKRIEFQRGPIHSALVGSKHTGALEYFKETIALLRDAIAQEEGKP